VACAAAIAGWVPALAAGRAITRPR
jgi:hypothetical protein